MRRGLSHLPPSAPSDEHVPYFIYPDEGEGDAEGEADDEDVLPAPETHEDSFCNAHAVTLAWVESDKARADPITRRILKQRDDFLHVYGCQALQGRPRPWPKVAATSVRALRTLLVGAQFCSSATRSCASIREGQEEVAGSSATSRQKVALRGVRRVAVVPPRRTAGACTFFLRGGARAAPDLEWLPHSLMGSSREGRPASSRKEAGGGSGTSKSASSSTCRSHLKQRWDKDSVGLTTKSSVITALLCRRLDEGGKT